MKIQQLSNFRSSKNEIFPGIGTKNQIRGVIAYLIIGIPKEKHICTRRYLGIFLSISIFNPSADDLSFLGDKKNYLSSNDISLFLSAQCLNFHISFCDQNKDTNIGFVACTIQYLTNSFMKLISHCQSVYQLHASDQPELNSCTPDLVHTLKKA